MKSIVDLIMVALAVTGLIVVSMVIPWIWLVVIVLLLWKLINKDNNKKGEHVHRGHFQGHKGH